MPLCGHIFWNSTSIYYADLRRPDRAESTVIQSILEFLQKLQGATLQILYHFQFATAAFACSVTRWVLADSEYYFF